jgi:hypothetical protein
MTQNLYYSVEFFQNKRPGRIWVHNFLSKSLVYNSVKGLSPY